MDTVLDPNIGYYSRWDPKWQSSVAKPSFLMSYCSLSIQPLNYVVSKFPYTFWRTPALQGATFFELRNFISSVEVLLFGKIYLMKCWMYYVRILLEKYDGNKQQFDVVLVNCWCGDYDRVAYCFVFVYIYNRCRNLFLHILLSIHVINKCQYYWNMMIYCNIKLVFYKLCRHF